MQTPNPPRDLTAPIQDVASLRKSRGLTLTQFAAQSGVHSSYLARIERGSCSPSNRVRAKISGALGVDVANITFGLAAEEADRAFDRPQSLFAIKIREARCRADLAQKEVAKRIGFSSQYVSRLECESAHPTRKISDALSNLFGFNAHEMWDFAQHFAQSEPARAGSPAPFQGHDSTSGESTDSDRLSMEVNLPRPIIH